MLRRVLFSVWVVAVLVGVLFAQLAYRRPVFGLVMTVLLGPFGLIVVLARAVLVRDRATTG